MAVEFKGRTALEEYNRLYAFAVERGLEKNRESSLENFPIFLGGLMHDFKNTYNERGDATTPEIDSTIPMLNLFGTIYPRLDKQRREVVLQTTIRVLEELDGKGGVVPDGTERVNGKEAVSRIHEPLLNGDLIINTSDALWPKLFRLEKGMSPEEFDKWFLTMEGARHKSLFWGGAYPLSRVDGGYDLPLVRKQFVDKYSVNGLVERAQDAIAALIHNSSERNNALRIAPYEQGVEKRILSYAEDWRAGIRAGLERKSWVYLPLILEGRSQITKVMKIPERK